MPAWISFAAALALAASAPAAIDVPYLPQADALCGGAAVAMVFRYWGDAHADIQQFAPLVDARAGGIRTDALVSAVDARGWRATPIVGTIDLLREQLDARRPVVALIEDRRLRYHYVVVIGLEATAVVVHDPAVGPSRRIPLKDWQRVWAPTHDWALVIVPGDTPRPVRAAAPPVTESTSSTLRSRCDQLLADAVADVQRRGLASAEDVFAAVSRQCPSSPGPARELAGVRFAEQRWRAASALARTALALDDRDAYSWDVLASSEFMLGDTPGALVAWNHAGKPLVDTVTIEGAARTRYQLLAQWVGMTPNTLLTSDAFERAGLRAAALPDRLSSRVSIAPGDDGYAKVDVDIAELPPYPRTPITWAATAARFAIDREAAVSLPDGTGQGEVWDASWRWWHNRPRVALAFVAPRVGWMPGVWRVEGSWERQSYAASASTPQTLVTREARAHGGVEMSEWVSEHLRYGVNAGADLWSDANGDRRTASVGGTLEERFFAGRVSVSERASEWLPLGPGQRFATAAGAASFASSIDSARWLFTAVGGADAATDGAPLALWPGAGDGHARQALLRAHPLLDDGVLVGPAFGRTLVYASAEQQRWFERGPWIHFGGAAFVDAARAGRGLSGADPRALVDAGLGLRVRIPGSGTIRVDVARGLRDGAHAVSVGWVMR